MRAGLNALLWGASSLGPSLLLVCLPPAWLVESESRQAPTLCRCDKPSSQSPVRRTWQQALVPKPRHLSSSRLIQGAGELIALNGVLAQFPMPTASLHGQRNCPGRFWLGKQCVAENPPKAQVFCCPTNQEAHEKARSFPCPTAHQ